MRCGPGHVPQRLLRVHHPGESPVLSHCCTHSTGDDTRCLCGKQTSACHLLRCCSRAYAYACATALMQGGSSVIKQQLVPAYQHLKGKIGTAMMPGSTHVWNRCGLCEEVERESDSSKHRAAGQGALTGGLHKLEGSGGHPRPPHPNTLCQHLRSHRTGRAMVPCTRTLCPFGAQETLLDGSQQVCMLAVCMHSICFPQHGLKPGQSLHLGIPLVSATAHAHLFSSPFTMAILPPAVGQLRVLEGHGGLQRGHQRLHPQVGPRELSVLAAFSCDWCLLLLCGQQRLLGHLLVRAKQSAY